MTSTLQAWTDLATPFTRVVDDVAYWPAPSPCEGWSAADVLAHVIETQRDFLTRHGVDLDGAPDVAADPPRAWGEHAATMRDRLADDAVAALGIDGFFGPTTIGATMLAFYGFDLLVHRWDLARAAGRDERFSDAELDTIERAVDGFGEHLYGDGICKPGVAVKAGSGRQERLLARMGRQAD